MVKYRVTYDRTLCIGEFACFEAASQFWTYGKDGKADLKAAAYNQATKKWELVIDEHDYDDLQASAEECLAKAVVIEKISDEPSGGNFGDWKEDESRKDWEPSVKEPNCPMKDYIP